MKKIISFFCLSILVVFVLANFTAKYKKLNTTNKNNKELFNRPPTSLLDSLQGNWVLYDDSLSKFKISGRNLLMYYDQGANSTQPDDSYRIYFSDVITGEGENFYSLTGVDTTATSGEYLLRVQNNDNSYSSFRINGFNQSPSESTFSLTATYSTGSNINYLYKKE